MVLDDEFVEVRRESIGYLLFDILNLLPPQKGGGGRSMEG